MSDQVSGDTSLPRLGQEPFSAIEAAMEAFYAVESKVGHGEPETEFRRILHACRAYARALAPEPSGVPPEDRARHDVLLLRALVASLPLTEYSPSEALQSWYNNMKVVMERTNPVWLTPGMTDLMVPPEGLDKYLNSELGRATTEVERVARATLEEVLREPGVWVGSERLPSGEVVLHFTDGADRIVARVVARLSATPTEEAR